MYLDWFILILVHVLLVLQTSLIGKTQCGNFGHFYAPKTAILTIRAALNFEVLEIFEILKCEILNKVNIQSLQNC